MITPLGCPFCGRKGSYWVNKPYCGVECLNKNCPVNPTLGGTKRSEVIEAWNTRAECKP